MTMPPADCKTIAAPDAGASVETLDRMLRVFSVVTRARVARRARQGHGPMMASLVRRPDAHFHAGSRTRLRLGYVLAGAQPLLELEYSTS
jgi:hypothetical protein